MAADGKTTPMPLTLQKPVAPAPGALTGTSRADASGAAALTGMVRGWMGDVVHVDAERGADIELATYEALSNCAEHAYRDGGTNATMQVHATYDVRRDTVRVCVTDHGRWVDPATQPDDLARGRGVRLMHAVADDVSIMGSTSGTTVAMSFSDCVRRSA